MSGLQSQIPVLAISKSTVDPGDHFRVTALVPVTVTS